MKLRVIGILTLLFAASCATSDPPVIVDDFRPPNARTEPKRKIVDCSYIPPQVTDENGNKRPAEAEETAQCVARAVLSVAARAWR